MARTTAISIYRGEDVTINFTCYTTDSGSTPEDITGWTLAFTVAEARNSTSKLISVAGSLVAPASGTFSVSLTDTGHTDSLAPGSYLWDVWRTDSGYERLLGVGPFVLIGNARIPPSA